MNLVSNHAWFKGSSFLWDRELPLKMVEVVTVDKDDPEIKKGQAVFVCQSKSVVPFPTLLERLEYFSSWQHAKQAIALCLRLKEKCVHRLVKKSVCVDINVSISEHQPTSISEMNEAERVICLAVQTFYFEEEIKQLLIIL